MSNSGSLNSERTELESDIDKRCKFLEVSTRVRQPDDTMLLTRINEESCGGKLRSRTVSTLTLGSTGVRLKHRVDLGEPLQCLWRKRSG